MARKPAILLLSGGLDSYTTGGIMQSSGFDIYALSFDYGQRHTFELDAAGRVAESLKVKDHKFVRFDLGKWGGSALTGDEEVPKDKLDENAEGTIPVTYVPARNTIFLSFGLGYAEVIGAFDIFIGANAIDYSGYPDCRPEYLTSFENVANLATKAGVQGTGKFTINAPLLKLSKKEIILRGLDLGLDYGLTHSCYDPDEAGRACGHCDACLLRLRAFAEVGMDDPIGYQP